MFNSVFNFTPILSPTVSVIQDALTLIDPTTFFGGVVTAAIMGTLMVSLVRRVRRLAR